MIFEIFQNNFSWLHVDPRYMFGVNLIKIGSVVSGLNAFNGYTDLFLKAVYPITVISKENSKLIFFSTVTINYTSENN